MPTGPDVSILAELLEHQDFVRRLARGLAADEHGAEDLAQEVWATAIARPPRVLDSARGWLARVARSLAANRARGERNRRDRELRRHADRPTEAVADAERAFELQRSIATAVHRLDEPYRAVILLSYFRGLSHAEIAAETGAPIATVRTRLMRGRERLRAALDAEHGGDRETWMRGVALLLGRDLLAPASLATSAAGGAALWGGIVMGTTAKLALGAAVVAGAAWLAWPDGEVEGGADARAEGLSGASAALTPADALATNAAEEIATAAAERGRTAVEVEAEVASAEPAADSGWFVRGTVRGLDGVDASEAEVSVIGLTDYAWPAELTATGRVAADGTFDVDLTRLVLREGRTRPALHGLRVAVEHPLRQRASVDLAAEPEHHATAELAELAGPVVWQTTVELRVAATIEGRVVNADESPAAGARVAAWRLVAGEPETEPADVTLCAADGSFTLRLAHEGEHALAALDEGLRPANARAFAAVGERRTLDAPLELDPGAALGGRVVRRGLPLAGVTVQVFKTRRARTDHYVTSPNARTVVLAWIDGAMEYATKHTTSGEDGGWRLSGLRPDLYRLSAGAPPGPRLQLGWRRHEVTARAPDHAIELECSDAVLSFSCADELASMGRGVMRVAPEGRAPHAIDFRGQHGVPSFSGEPGLRVAVDIDFEGFETWRRELVLPGPGEQRDVDVKLLPAPPPASLELDIQAPPEVAIDTVTLTLFSADGGDREEKLTEETVDVVEGRARVGGIAPGRYHALLRATNQPHGVYVQTYVREVSFPLEVTTGEHARREVEFELGGRLGIVARDSNGAPIAANVELRDAQGDALDVRYRAQSGRSSFIHVGQLSTRAANETFPNLAPGEYEVELWLDGFDRRVERVVVEAGKTTPVDVTLAAK